MTVNRDRSATSDGLVWRRLRACVMRGRAWDQVVTLAAP